MPSLQAILMIGENPGSGPGFAFENLSIARITMINKGNQDIEEFSFGVTLKGDNKAVDVKLETSDRHHTITLLTPSGLRNPPKQELDFTLKPFNRSESYSLNIYFTYTDIQGSIELSSSHSTRFIEIGAKKEMVEDIVIRVLKDSLRRSLPGI